MRIRDEKFKKPHPHHSSTIYILTLRRWIKKEKFFRDNLRFERVSPFANDQKVDFSLLSWSEALKFFCEENYLVRVNIFAKQDEVLRENTIPEPHQSLRVPTDLLNGEILQALRAGVTLHLQFGEGCGKEQPTKATNVVYDEIFGYNKFTWAQYCSFLATCVVRVYPGVTIDLHPKYRSNFRDLVPDFLLELAHTRSAGNVWVTGMTGDKFFDSLAYTMSFTAKQPWEWHDLMIGMIEEAAFRSQNESFDAGYNLFTRAFNVAQMALNHSAGLFRNPELSTEDRLYTSGTLAICTKVFYLHACVVHLRIESRLTNGRYPPNTYPLLKKLYRSMTNAREWPGLSSRQNAGAMFVAGLFWDHLAGFLATPGNIQIAQNDPNFLVGTDIAEYRREAARFYFAAAKINPAKFEQDAMARWNSLYDTHGNGAPREVFEAKLVTLSTAIGGEWYGLEFLWNFWGRNKIQHLERIREKKDLLKSKAQIKKGRERMGIGNVRKEPAGLLRCLMSPPA